MPSWLSNIQNSWIGKIRGAVGAGPGFLSDAAGGSLIMRFAGIIHGAAIGLPVLFGLLLSAAGASAQDQLNGIWKGTLTQGPGGCYPQYFLELQIHAAENGLTGTAYDYYDKTHYVKMSFTGRYNAATHRMVLIENRILQADVPADCQPCMKTYDLTWSPGAKPAAAATATKPGLSHTDATPAGGSGAAKPEDNEELNGDWKGVYSEKRLVCPPGMIRLKKAASTDFPVDIDQSDTLALLQQTLQLKPREKSIVKTVLLPTPKVTIELYDNAEIDQDTVTVLINNKLLLYRQMLTDRPLTIQFNAFPNTEYELVMYADNLGRIPPNTALMMVTAGDQKFQVFLSSSEDKSAAVRFVYRP